MSDLSGLAGLALRSAFCYFMLLDVPGRLCSAGFDRELEKAPLEH